MRQGTAQRGGCGWMSGLDLEIYDKKRPTSQTYDFFAFRDVFRLGQAPANYLLGAPFQATFVSIVPGALFTLYVPLNG
jgi:hypothetical protein